MESARDPEWEELDHVYARAWADGMFLVEWQGFAVAGWVDWLRDLEQQTGREFIDNEGFKQLTLQQCYELGASPASSASRVEACREAVVGLKRWQAEKDERYDERLAEDISVARPLVNWDGNEKHRHRSLVWWTRLDGRYQVEVQRTGRESGLLLIFDHNDGNRTVHHALTQLLHEARFGPDVFDVERWEEAAAAAVDALPGRQ